MALPRFFIDQPSSFFDGRVALPDKAARHAGRSLRLREGERVELFNGSGAVWRGPIGFSADGAWVTIDETDAPALESPLRITLLQSFVAPEKTDWITEKAVEAGVSAIVLAPAQRSVTKLSRERLEKRLARLADIARAACEQSGRSVVPSVAAEMKLEDAFTNIEAERRLILAPSAKNAEPNAGVAPGLASAAIAVGPEGGFSPEEIALAESLGWQAALLGPRVLRTETAGLAAAVWLQTLAGDFPR